MNASARVGAVLRAAWRNHSTAVLGAVGLLVIALRVMGVSSWNSQTALAIVRESDTGTVLLGTVLWVAEFAVVLPLYAIAICVGTLGWPRRTWVRVWLAGVPFALLLLFVPVAPKLAFGELGMWLASPAFRPVFRDDDRTSTLGRVALQAVGLIFALPMGLTLLVGGLAGDQPWQPLEVVRLTDGTARAGWVLRADDEVVLLDGRTRQVVYLRGPLRARAICRGRRERADRSLAVRWGWIGGEPYPRCTGSLV
jgi:hypothetical protein